MEAEAAVEKVVVPEKTIALVTKTATEEMPVAVATAAAMAQLVDKAGSPHATVSAA